MQSQADGRDGTEEGFDPDLVQHHPSDIKGNSLLSSYGLNTVNERFLKLSPVHLGCSFPRKFPSGGGGGGGGGHRSGSNAPSFTVKF